MAGDFEARLSRLERRCGHREGRPDFSGLTKEERDRMRRMLQDLDLPDLRCLEGLLTRVESGDPSQALTAAEQEWLEGIEKRLEAYDGE